jgi:hypothetical protein
MKIRVKVPEEICQQGLPAAESLLISEWVDEVLLWGMETGMDIAFYSFYYEHENEKMVYGLRYRTKPWAVFTVEKDYTFMFSLKWGALMHKSQNKQQAA